MIRTSLPWLLVCILFAALMIQLAQWKGARDTESDLARVKTTPIRAEHQKWREVVSDADKKRHRLEQQLLWRAPNQLLPQLAKVAEELGLALIGVEELQERHREDYRSFPLQLTFSGDYAGFSGLLAVVEGIKPMIRIDELRLYQRKRQREGLWLSLTLSLMDKGDASTGAGIEMPVALNFPTNRDSRNGTDPVGTIARFSVKREPFGFDKIIGTVSSLPNRDQSRAKAAPLPQLTGILWDDENPIAILSHGSQRQSVRVGEVVAGVTIISIQPQLVIVKRDKKRYELKVWKQGKGVKLK